MNAWVVAAVGTVGILGLVATAAHAQSGVQWSRDGKRLMASKDVGDERWAITYNLDDGSATGNVFFPEGGDPAFITCEKTGDNGSADLFALQLNYSCHGADPVPSGPFLLSDWGFIRNVTLPFDFFLPEPDTCQFYSISNGPNASAANSFWDCDGNLELQIFENGTGVSSDLGALSLTQTGCASAVINAGGDLGSATVLSSPSLDIMNFIQRGFGTDTIFECERVLLQ